MAQGFKRNGQVKVRDAINDYGKKYGITNTDIGYIGGSGGGGGAGNVLIDGQDFLKPSYLDDSGSTWDDPNVIKDAVDQYAQRNGMSDLSQGIAGNLSPSSYVSPYSDKIDAILNNLLNPEEFSFDPETSPSFQAYKKQYGIAGDRAMTNEMGAAAGMTGGRLNSWAMTAGGQAKANFNDQLMSRIPELEQLAYGMHRDKLNDNARNLGLVEGLDNQGYGRYTDNLNYNRGVYENDRSFNRSVLDTNNNNAYRDNRADRSDYESNRAYNYQVTRDKVLDSEWMKQFNAEEQKRIIDEALQKRQISISEANAATSRTQANWSMDAKNPDNQYKQKQVDAASKEAEKESALGAAYSDMMKSKDPQKWLIDNAQFLYPDELKALAGYIPNPSTALQQAIAKKLEASNN